MQPRALNARLVWALPISVSLLLMAGCASNTLESSLSDTGQTRRDYGDSHTFPVPNEIQDNVDFWRHVYGIWGRGEVVIHDSEYLGVIYEVARIPGPIQASYTQSQRAWLSNRMDYYRSRLTSLEQRVRDKQRLSADDKALLETFKRVGEVEALPGASERLRAQRGIREKFRRGVEISGRYDAIFREIMRQHGVPEDLAFLPHVESSFQTNARSSVGAGGVWQFMPATGRQYMNVNAQVDDRFDPILAANGAARYLSTAHRQLGSWPLAITSYNHGKGGMANAKAQYGDDIGLIVTQYKGPNFGFASRNFYAEFVAAREVASHTERYFPEGITYEEPWRHDRIALRDSMPADHLARHYGTSKPQLAELNLHWRDSVIKGNSHLPAGTTVWLPAGTTRRIASQPPAFTRAVASAKPATPSVSSRTAVARTTPATKPVAVPKASVMASTKAKAPPSKTKTRYHVVKPQETLYRVAVQNGISVDELRKLNRMQPGDNKILPGQKLIVGI
ncbi:lytic transglycosylase domain-containing protein [Allochromatium palmeri]|uniref:Transglycosylase SLT domain-containing protein n=1 Tax=Allochromatium palmeri TaxID=231048 RepID=A0A6N8EE20_9GAMM|nr:lytic transglycosylase domain-containing protein [Allochromatium palmeri]MTW21149.1 transglycosylase SLT domain-containing protein [Allochromatium palmeri]